MTFKIHLICKANAGLTCVDAKAGVYESEAWLLSEDEVVALKDGEILFHETKKRPSYFGGVILDIRPAEGSEKDQGRQRRVITLQSTAACRGVDWDESGQVHDMAWTSGVIATTSASSEQDA